MQSDLHEIKWPRQGAHDSDNKFMFNVPRCYVPAEARVSKFRAQKQATHVSHTAQELHMSRLRWGNNLPLFENLFTQEEHTSKLKLRLGETKYMPVRTFLHTVLTYLYK